MKKIYIELADTHIKREYGLMDRKSLNNNSGMLFKFPYANYLSFWMKNTYIPLDIAFISDEGKILQIEAMSPLSTRMIRSRNICRYALEVNRGWFDKKNINVGSLVGGIGIKLKKEAQATPLGNPLLDDLNDPLTVPDLLPEQDQQEIPNQQEQQEQQEINPDVMLNMSFKQILDDADIRNKKLVILYQTKGEVSPSVSLPPKVISPPFTFVDSEEGETDAVVNVWDEQDASWKSFIIDNIIDLEPFEEN